MEKKRIEWIDIAKGIAMVLVIIGHIPIPRYLSVFIYGCHMPLFFILSGYVLKDKGESIGEFCRKKAKGLLIPLLIYSIIIIIFRFIYYGILVKSVSMASIKNEVIGIFLQMKNGGTYSSTLWFLPCMFLAIIIVFLIIRKVKSKKMHIVWTIILGIAGSCVYYVTRLAGLHNGLPWCLDYVLMAATVIYIGYILANHTKINLVYTLINGIIYIFTCIWSYKLYDFSPCLFGETGNMGVVWIQSISGSLMIVGIASSLKNRKISILTYIGKNSLFFYAMQFIVFAIVDVIFYNVLKIKVDTNSLWILIFDACYLIVTLFVIDLLNEAKIKIFAKKKGANDAK